MVVRYIRKGPVGYTTKGSPTIVDGVVSGFSAADKIEVNLDLSSSTANFEHVIKFTTPADTSVYNCLYAQGGTYVYFRNSTLSAQYSYGGSNRWRTLASNLSPSTTYYLKLVRAGEAVSYSYLSTNGVNYVLQNTEQTYPFFLSTNKIVYGYGNTNYPQWNGSIDLNETYIKVNGEVRFGKEIFIPKTQIIHNSYSGIKDNILLKGEPAYEADTNSMKVGNGTDTYDELPYLVDNTDEWQKPDDWIDIRSGALPNSVYFLVGHSEDYQTYPEFGASVELSGSNNTYDVYVDGIKQGTYATGSTGFLLNWQTLALSSGYAVTYPATLRTHIVRITPTDSTVTIENIKQKGSSAATFGTLWIHFAITNSFKGLFLCPGSSSGSTVVSNPVLEAVTTNQETLKLTGTCERMFSGCTSLKTLPVLDLENATSIKRLVYQCQALKKIKIKNLNSITSSGSVEDAFNACSNIKYIDAENSSIPVGYQAFKGCSKMRNINAVLNFSGLTLSTGAFTTCTSLNPIILDASTGVNITRISLGASDTNPVRGIKGITVSPEAPFDNATSPQLDVSYTGMDRAALVNLFKSMPYNVGYTVVGSPTITDGVASGFSSDNYLQFYYGTFPSAEMKKYEIYTKFTTSTTLNTRQGIISSGNYLFASYGLALNTSGKVTARLPYKKAGDNTNYSLDVTVDSALAANTTYYAKYVANLETGQLTVGISTDGQTYTEATDTATDYYAPLTRTWKLCIGLMQASDYFTGSIDLNQTYININDVPWFRGTAAMTKTCSIVGCTGTADLTAADKAIAEDKGWELVLS